MKQTREFSAWLLVLVVLFLGSGGGLVKGLDQLAIWEIICLRALLACVIQWSLCRQCCPFGLTSQQIKAATWVALANSFFIWSVAWSPSGFAFLYSCSGAAYTAAIALMLDRKRPGSWEAIAIISLTLMGIHIGISDALEVHQKLGVLWGAAAGLFLALFLRAQAKIDRTKQSGTIVLANLSVAVLGVFLALVGFASDSPALFDFEKITSSTLQAKFYLLALGVLQSGLGFRWLALARGTFGASVAYCVILASIVAPWLSLWLAGEQIDAFEYAISLVIHGIVALAVRQASRR